jgi:hypothetical protein
MSSLFNQHWEVRYTSRHNGVYGPGVYRTYQPSEARAAYDAVKQLNATHSELQIHCAIPA